MKIFVKAKTGAKEGKIEKIRGTIFQVFVKELPEKGKANAAIIRAVAVRFGVAPSRVRILSGARSKRKVIEIL